MSPDPHPSAAAPGAPAAGSRSSRALALFKRLGPAGLLGIAWVAMPPLASIVLFWNIKLISEWLRSHEWQGLFLYIIAFMVLAGLGMLPTYAQAILGGWCFGLLVGLPAALAGFAGAALIGYVVARTVSRHRVEDVIESNAKSRAVRDALIGQGFLKTFSIVTLLRLPPNSPFALTNLVMASAGIRLAPFILGTVVGMTPRTALAVYLGSGVQTLTKQTFTTAPSVVYYGGIAVSLLIVLVIGHIANKAIARVTAARPGHTSRD